MNAHGFVCAHTHLYSALAPLGMPPPQPPPRTFREILERVWWRLDRALDLETLAAAARLGIAEALLEGTSVLVDHHESPRAIEGSLDVIADAAQELGARLLVCYGATERNGGRDEARAGLAECRRFLATNDRPLVAGCVGLHASFTVSDDTLREAGALARELGTVVHVHVAEAPEDVEDARARGHAGPLERLLAHDALPPGSILAHGVHLDEDQVRACAERGLWLVQNPRSNHVNGVGYPRALGASERVALGTDGFPADMLEEASWLVAEAAAHGEDPAVAGRRLAAGADIARERFGDLDGDAVGRGELLVGGRVVVQDGRLVTDDIERIRARAQEAAQRLWRSMAEL